MIKVTLTRSAKINQIWRKPGDVVDFADDDGANRLIRLKAATLHVEPEKKAVEEPKAPAGGSGGGSNVELDDEVELISSIEGVSDELASLLVKEGFNTIQKVAEANPDDLTNIRGIGNKSVEKIQDSAEEIIQEADKKED